MEVAEVQFLPRADDLGVLLQIQPSHVGEEEPAHSIVRVGVGLGVLVVDAMVARPVQDGSLIGNGVAQHEEDADRERGTVRPVGPEAMGTNGDAETAS